MTTEERIQKEANKIYVLPHRAEAYIAGATIEAARNKENAVALEKEIEMLRGALSELVKWCEPDDRWNYMAAIEKAKQILNTH